jgi:hypothetical protein
MCADPGEPERLSCPRRLTVRGEKRATCRCAATDTRRTDATVARRRRGSRSPKSAFESGPARSVARRRGSLRTGADVRTHRRRHSNRAAGALLHGRSARSARRRRASTHRSRHSNRPPRLPLPGAAAPFAPAPSRSHGPKAARTARSDAPRIAPSARRLLSARTEVGARVGARGLLRGAAARFVTAPSLNAVRCASPGRDKGPPGASSITWRPGAKC